MISEFIEWLLKFFGWEIKPGVRAVQKVRTFLHISGEGVLVAFLQKYRFIAEWKKPLANAGCAALLLEGGIG